METIGSFEAKTHWSSILDRVASGQEIIITKRGKPIARLIPEFNHDEISADDILSKLRALRKTMSLTGANWRDLRDEGRI